MDIEKKSLYGRHKSGKSGKRKPESKKVPSYGRSKTTIGGIFASR